MTWHAVLYLPVYKNTGQISRVYQQMGYLQASVDHLVKELVRCAKYFIAPSVSVCGFGG